MEYSYEKYCSSCGAVIDKNAAYCPKCGAKQMDIIKENNIQKDPNKIGDLNKNWLITVLLCFFVGSFGVHRFYNGKIGTGILMLITLGGFGIWYIIDFIIVVVGKFKDKNGNYIEIN